MFSITKQKNKQPRVLAENDTHYVYFDKDAPANTFDSNSELFLIPDPNNREVLFFSGPSGAGKSTSAAHYVERWVKIHPKGDVYLFSRKDEDPVFDKIKEIYRIKIDDQLIENPIDILSMVEPNTLLIFDDIDSLDKKYWDAIAKIMYDVLEVGRSYKIYCIITSHLINSNNKKFSRIILNEAHFVTFYKNTNYRGNRYYLKEYVGLPNDAIKQIMSEDTRAITIHKNFPNFYMTKSKIALLRPESN